MPVEIIIGADVGRRRRTTGQQAIEGYARVFNGRS
jgi:phage head maturation protease